MSASFHREFSLCHWLLPLLFGSFFISLTSFAATSEILTNTEQVLDLSAAQAAKGLPVKMEGVVVDDSDPREHAVIFENQGTGIYLLAKANLFAHYHRGDILQISGVTIPGQFAPCILTDKVKKLGVTNNIPTRPATYQQIITGALDAQFITITGVVRQRLPDSSAAATWRIILAADGGTIPVRISVPEDPKVQVDAEITIQAVCLYQFNARRQALTPVLQVPRGVPITIEKPSPSDPFSEPLRPVGTLLQYSPHIPFGHRIHVKGILTSYQPGSTLWIRDATSGLRIQSSQEDKLHPGDIIDVLGFPGYGSSTPILEDAIYRKTDQSSPPIPLLLTNLGDAYDHQDDLICAQGTLTDVQPIINGLLLTLNDKETVFKAILKFPLNPTDEPNWQPGSVIRVSGICDVIYDGSQPTMGIWHPQSFQIIMRSLSDVAVVKPAPWWTASHIIAFLGAVVGTLLLISGFIALRARHRLNEQALQRAMAETEFTAILSERNRLAREIHDTLAQGLTATSVQLQLVKIHARGAADNMFRHLEIAQDLVRDSLEKARNSIWNMRSQVLETGNLADALKDILERLAEGTVKQTHFEVTGKQRRLPAMVENNVLQLGQEAITNATKHAGASQIRVTLDFGTKYFSLNVTDNGKGFDPANPPPSEGGFGLVGMRERAKELNASLEIKSDLQNGTSIQLRVPLLGE